MRLFVSFAAVLLLLSSNAVLFSQDFSEQAQVELKVDLPFFDLPYQPHIMGSMGYGFFHTYGSMSMNQSLSLSMGVYSSMHYGMKKLYDSLDLDPVWKNIIYYGGTAAGLLGFAYIFPFGYPWVKQEFTRSILSRHGIGSNNGRYDIPIIINPTGFTDDQLIHLKATSPVDFIRLSASVTEGYSLFSERMARNYFFYDLDDLSFVPALIATWVNAGITGAAIAHEYGVINCDSQFIDPMYKDDKGQTDRFFYGEQTPNWVYDLFRPDEPYAARGAHPSGDGSVARYIKFEQLTDDERRYLLIHSWLSYLNYASPLLYSFNSFELGDSGFLWNFALHHYLTSFGGDVSATMFLKKGAFNMAFALHNYFNYQNYFPAVEAELVDYQLNLGKLGFLLSPRVIIGMQPKDQVFKTSSPEFLGLFGLRVDYMASRHFLPYLDFIVKTDGWVAGNEYLSSSASVRLGVSMRF